jgi:tight adherence protein B
VGDLNLDPMLIAVLVALAAAGAVFAFIYPYISGDRQKDQRLARVSEGRRRVADVTGDAQNRRKNVADTLKEMEARQKASEKISLRLRLQRAGLQISPRDFYMLSAIGGIVLAAVVVVVLGMPLMAGVAAAFVGGLGLPRWVLGKMTKRRQHKFVSELANAIDVIVRGVKSGLPLNECIQVIARESPEPLASEFQEVVDQQRMGVPLSECLDRLCTRMPLQEIRFLAIVIAIQQQAGGNLSEALANLSGVLRDRFMLAMKVKALSAEAKASAIVLASLPPGVMGMVTLASPEYIQPLYTTTVGHFMMIGSGLWMLTGVLMMRKMINFKF